MLLLLAPWPALASSAAEQSAVGAVSESQDNPIDEAAEVSTFVDADLGAEQTGVRREGLREELRRLVGHARDQVFPALVSIRVVTVQYSGGKEIKGHVVGSGTVVSPQGHVVTNEHVTRNGRRFECTLSDKRWVSATLIGEDPLTDLAVLQLDLEALGGPPPVARFGRSSELEVGDVVMAMGSPFSLSRSVSLGIVSNTERVFAGGFGSDDLEELELDNGQRTGLFTRWIQHDAQISPGNSGGPLVNLAGEIVGVNELGGGAHSFAIPSDLAKEITRDLVEKGRVDRGWLGFSIKPIQRTGLLEGVLISSVTVGGPAAQAGIRAGDLLLALDGEPITVRFVEEVPLLLGRIAGLGAGTEHQLRVRRAQEELEVTVTAAELERDLGEHRAFHAWGLTAREITPKMARDYRLSSEKGVLITGVRRAGPAEQSEPAVGRGDILLRMADRPIDELADLVKLYLELTAEGVEPAPAVLELDRRGKSLVTYMKPTAETSQDPPRELPKAWIGIATQPVLGDLAEGLGLADQRGFRITRVYPGTRAEEAGLKVGDLVLGLNGEALVPRGYEDAALLERRVRNLPIDSVANLDIQRTGDRLSIPAVLEKTRLGRDEARRYADRDFEITVRELTFFDRDENRWDPEVRGVLVEMVDPGGWAGLGGLRPGDLVQRVDDREIRGLRSFRAAMEAIASARPQRVVMVVLRGARTYFQFLEPDWAPEVETTDGRPR